MMSSPVTQSSKLVIMMGSFAATVQLNCLHYRKTMLQQCSSRVTPEESQTVGGLSSWLPGGGGGDFFSLDVVITKTKIFTM